MLLLSPDLAPRTILTLTEMIDRVRGDLGLRGSDRITDTDVTEWLNEGQAEIARLLRWYRTSFTTGSTSGTKEYALPIPVAGRCIQIEEVIYNDEQLLPTTLEELQRIDWNYRQAGTGTPDYYYLRGNTGFGLHVTPDTTDTDNLLVIYVGLPPRVTAPLDFMYVVHGGQQALIIYAKKLASEKDKYGEGQRGVALYEAQWQAALASLKRQVDQVSERQAVVMGGNALLEGEGLSRVPHHTTIGQ